MIVGQVANLRRVVNPPSSRCRRFVDRPQPPHTQPHARCILYGMPIESTKLGSGVAVVKISGRLVFGREVDRLETTVSDLLKEGPLKVVFDLSALDYVDSSGIGTIVSCLTQIKKAGSELRTAGANPRIKRLLTMTGVDKLLTLYPTVSEATAG